jgi:hypothetical protein
MSNSAPMRAALGFLSAALAVLIFHQGMVAILYFAQIPGLEAGAPYSLAGVPPLGVPRVVDLCFWGGLYGIVFGLASPVLPRPLWSTGLAFGVIAALVGLFVVAAIKGQPLGGGWVINNWVRSLLINGAWGVGMGIIYPMLAPGPRGLRRA